jgi:siroheme synthase
VVTGTLADITARAEEERIASPAVFVIGSVVALQEQISRGALSLGAPAIEEDTYVRL